ncbi:MAG: hexokinase [Treponema sp.]|nr:hexokinase [Treponema sp.]
MTNAVSAFLAKHNFVNHADVNSIADALLYDMNLGINSKPSEEDMIRTWTLPPEKSACGKSVIVIDAGGTNFRSCLVSFDAEGKASISELEKTRMPGVEKELSRKEFFDQFAVNLEHLKNKADTIGFCFSYPMTITEDGDGILLGFSKEVKAPEVVGSKIGASLADALVEHGWNRPKTVTLLNDTVAALLAGAARPANGNQYSSYMGLILGTGLNAAYIQPAVPGLKDFEKAQIVVCESGKLCKVSQSDFDKAVDANTNKPGTFFLEKSCSGAYMGPIAFHALKACAQENMVSKAVADKLLALESFTTIELSNFLQGPFCTETVLGKILAESGTEDDYRFIFDLLDAIVERSARYAAAILTACVVQSGEGKNPCKPVCILCNGSTYYKTYKIADRVKGYLEQTLTYERGINWEIVTVEDDITLGTAIAGLIER